MRTLRRTRHLMFLVAVAAFVMHFHGAPALAAAPIDYCDDPGVCNETTDCATECFYAENPLGWITCGDYDEGPSNGHCTGYCGDFYCDGWVLQEDANNCYDDCGFCGDSICTGAPEMWANSFCCQDCGSCGGGGDNCADSTECNGSSGLGCNWASHCCTSIPVTGCGSCDVWEDCVAWEGIGDFQYLCVTKGATCDGQS